MIIILLRLKETYTTPGQQGMNSGEKPTQQISTTSGTQASSNDIWDSTTERSTEYNNITETNLEFTKSQTSWTKQNKGKRRIPAGKPKDVPHVSQPL